ncbi:coatomer subunit zeta-1 isoform X1 [Zea mays]|uniref:coatomer subunit zeta-1 isoform X1 n=1 Tax=Zea mays TaxID=4577 RepID=UPI00165309C8|nr:uncharacterized protein LOC100274110 isoform X1 [Zea mays]
MQAQRRMGFQLPPWHRRLPFRFVILRSTGPPQNVRTPFSPSRAALLPAVPSPDHRPPLPDVNPSSYRDGDLPVGEEHPPTGLRGEARRREVLQRWLAYSLREAGLREVGLRQNPESECWNGWNMVDKRTALENLDLILLCLDEIVDGGIVLETEGREIAEKVSGHGSEGASSAEQTLVNALTQAREHLAKSLLM